MFSEPIGNDEIIIIDKNKTIQDLIKLYFRKKEKENLIVDNIENVYFIYNGNEIKYENNDQKIYSIFTLYRDVYKIDVFRLYTSKKYNDFKILGYNVYSSVHKAEVEKNTNPSQYLAIKNI